MSQMGVKYIDLEYGLDPNIYTDENLRKSEIILSHHDIKGMSNLEKVAREMLKIPASIYKIAVKVNLYNDNLKILDVGKFLSQQDVDAVCFGMGEKSEYSRIIAQKKPFSLHYLSAGNNRTAPGQLSVEYIRSLDINRINSDTEVYGIIGNPVEHSLSPLIHNKIFSMIGYNGLYIRFPVDNMQDFLTFMRNIDLKGLSITFPWKSAELYNYPNFIRSDDLVFDSINTIYKRDNYYHLADTDYSGFQNFFEKQVKLKPCKTLILGSGNTSVKIAEYLKKSGFHTEIVTRDSNKSTMPGYIDYTRICNTKYDLVINATPRNSNIIEYLDYVFTSFGTGVFIDINYSDDILDTIRLARERSWETFDGIGMLIEQALLQSYLWTGLKFSEELFTGLNDIIRKIIL
jgi:3-dehydroquinate dehydratase/shikimate dehydrogenase